MNSELHPVSPSFDGRSIQFEQTNLEPSIDTTCPKSVRKAIREGRWTSTTSGVCSGYLQANVVIMKRDQSDDFKKFCKLNPQSCPLLSVLDPGEKEAFGLAPGSNVATDLPKYRIYRHGKLTEEVTDISQLWTPDLVTFLIGCSFSFESALMKAGVPVRNIEQSKNVSMFITSRMCSSVGPFSSPLVVSYRPIPSNLVETAQIVTSKYGAAHGPPIHTGDPSELGIQDISKPDFGDPVAAQDGDVPMFWACGVTSTLAAISSQSDLIITHAPGHMFITDVLP